MKAGKRILAGVMTVIMAVTLLAGMPMGKDGVVNAVGDTLKGPSKDKNGVVTWDCVYFGSYPQSDATGKTKEPIKWRVLSVNGIDAFLVADQNLDAQSYHDAAAGNKGDYTWGYCTMRSWLNGYGSASNACKKDYSSDNFLNRAFTSAEKKAILLTKVRNADNPQFGTDGGYDTVDKIFLLSYDEVTNPAYGFSSNSKDTDKARRRTNTAYVAAGGTSGSRFTRREGTFDSWWLRSPGNTWYNTMYSGSDGNISRSGYTACGDDTMMEVCPALHLNLNMSSLWSYAGTVDSNGKSTEYQPENTEPAVTDLADVPKEVQAVTDASIAKQSSEDVKGAVFNALLARTTKLTNKTITLKWNKVSKADGYKIYGNKCGKKNHYKLIKDVGKSKTSYTQKKLKKGTYYKYVVAAYKVVDGRKVTIAVSKTIHATTTGGKYGVAKSVKVNKSKITLKKGKKFTIKAKEVKKDKKIKSHRKIAYESSNTKVATVSKKGVVKAKTKGSCYIYVYAQNGVYKRVKVTVK